MSDDEYALQNTREEFDEDQKFSTNPQSSQHFKKVFGIKGLRELIHSYQPGLEFSKWIDGDLAVKLGHTDIIMHNKNLIFTEKAIDHAAATGNLPMLELLWAKKLPCSEKAMDEAAGNGHLRVLEWLDQHFPEIGCSEKALYLAVKNKHHLIVNWLCQKKVCYPTLAMDYAAANGDLKLLKFFDQVHPYNYNEYAKNAAISGHLNVVEWVHKKGIIEQSVMTNAALGGHLDIILFLKDRGYLLTKNLAYAAVDGGHLSLLKYLAEEGVAITETVFEAAIESNHKEIAYWLNQTYGYPRIGNMPTNSLNRAAMNNNFELVRWLIGLGYQADHDTINQAATRGNLPMVQFLLPSVGTNSHLLFQAILSGNLELVKWLVNSGVVVTTDYLTAAVRSDKFTMVRWVAENLGIPPNSQALDTAISRNQLETAKYLYSRGLTSTDDKGLIEAAKNGHFKMVKWAYDKVPNPHIINNAAISGNLVMMQWLAQREEWSDYALDMAASGGHLTLISWLFEKQPFSAVTLTLAATSGHLAVVKWILLNLDQKHRTPKKIYNTIRQTIDRKNLEVIKTLYLNNREILTADLIESLRERASKPNLRLFDIKDIFE